MDSCVHHFRVNSISSNYSLQKCLLLGLRNHILFTRLLNSGFAQMRTRCLLWAGAAPGARSLAIGSGFAKDVPSSQATQHGEAVLQPRLLPTRETCTTLHGGLDS